MARTAEDILKSQGLSDADITAMAPMLSNATYRAAIENTVNKLEADVATWQQRDAEWQTSIDQQYTPAVTRAEQDAQAVRLKLAEAEAKLLIAKDYGYLPEGDAQAKADAAAAAVRNAANPQQNGKFNQNDPDFVNFAGDFATRQGRAMATYVSIQAQHQKLFGEPLEDFDVLYDKFAKIPSRERQNMSIRDMWEREYHVPEKRAEMTRKAQEAHDAEIFRKGEESYALKHGSNPMTSAPNPSRMPLMPTKVNDGKPVQPWDRPMATAERRQRAYETETRSRVN